MICNIHLLKLSAVRKVPETDLFQAHGIIETLSSIISHGTSQKFADVRTHLREVSKKYVTSIWKENHAVLFLCLCQFIKVPDLVHPAFIEVWLVANHEDRSLVFFQGPFQLFFGIHIQVVGRLI